MVGVPRSKGCRICVQRRVKCDQTRPTCNNCKKGNRPCPGYSHDLKFQDEGARLRKRFENLDSSTSTGTDSSRDSTDSPPDSISAQSQSFLVSEKPHINGTVVPPGNDDGNWDVVGLDVNNTQRRTFLGLLEGKKEAYALLGEDIPEHTYNLPSAFFPSAFDHSHSSDIQESFLSKNLRNVVLPDHITSPDIAQQQLVVAFKESLYPDNNSIPVYMKNHTRWLSHLPPLTGTNPLLDASVRAVTLVHIGRLNNSEPFVMESRPYYGQALRLLNKTLQDKQKGVQNETLCAVILLSFYEMFASDNNDSWIRHAGGVSALMRARGPARHRHGLDREIYLAYRYMLIIESFQEDVPCFLAEPEWIKLSDTIHDDLKQSGVSPERLEIFDLAEEFYQSMVILPAQSSDARAMWMAQQAGASPRCSRAQLIDTMTKSRVDFKSTFKRFEAALKKVGNSPTISLAHKDPLIGIEYVFANTFVSATYTGYWTVLTVLNMCLQGLQSSDKDLVDMYRMESRECALNICRSTAYMLTSSFLGPFFLIFGLRVGLLVFEDTDGPEADWILRKLFKIGDRHMGIAKHVPGYRPGITANELIAEFKLKKAQAKEQNSRSEDFEFARKVAYGEVFAPAESQDGNGPATDFGDIGGGGWDAFNQTEDVLKTWEDQSNFPIHEMSNLNVMGDASNSGTKSTRTSPMPPHTNDTNTQQFVPDASMFNMTDADFWSQNWDDETMWAELQQGFLGDQGQAVQPPAMQQKMADEDVGRFLLRRAHWNSDYSGPETGGLG